MPTCSNHKLQGGFNEDNDPIYIGRAHHEDSYAVGKVPQNHCPTNTVLSIP